MVSSLLILLATDLFLFDSKTFILFLLDIRYLCCFPSSCVMASQAYPEMLLNKRFSSSLEACRLFQDDPLVHSPGQKYLYSTYAFTLLSAAIERVSAQSGPIFSLPAEPAEGGKTKMDSIPSWAKIDTQLCRLFRFLGLRDTFLEYHEKMTPFRSKLVFFMELVPNCPMI